MDHSWPWPGNLLEVPPWWITLWPTSSYHHNKWDDEGLGPQGWPFTCLPDLVAHCREKDDYLLSTCLDQFCGDVVNFSWLFFPQWLYCSLHFLEKRIEKNMKLYAVFAYLNPYILEVQAWWIILGLDQGIHLKYQLDKSLFDLCHLITMTKTLKKIILANNLSGRLNLDGTKGV